MKSKIFLIFFVLILASMSINGQKHDNSQGTCRLFKNSARGEADTCPACLVIIKKEQDARDVENKKRQDAITKKAEAERLVKDAAYKKEMALREANRKVTEVKVVMPKSKLGGKTQDATKKVSKTVVKTKGVFKGKLYPISTNSELGLLLNSKQDTIIKSTEFRPVIPEKGIYSIDDMPDNVAIVEYKYLLDSEYPDSQFYPQNLIDSEMKKILNDDKISFIEYGKNSLFLVASGGSYTKGVVAKKIYIYDHLKNKITPIENVTSEFAFSPINGKGIDMTDYFDVKILAYNDIVSGKSNYGATYSSELDDIYKNSNDWLLLLSQSVGYKYGNPKYKYYYVDRERNLIPVGIFERD